MKFELNFEGWVGLTAALMKPGIDSHMLRWQKEENLCIASFPCYNLGKTS